MRSITKTAKKTTTEMRKLVISCAQRTLAVARVTSADVDLVDLRSSFTFELATHKHTQPDMCAVHK